MRIERFNEAFWNKKNKKKEDQPVEEPKVEVQPVDNVEFLGEILGKKSLDDLSSEEKQNIPHETWLQLSPYIKKDCYHCEFLKGYISLWCTNKEAVAYRGTAFPGVYNCLFWEPNEENIEKSRKSLNDIDNVIDSISMKLKINHEYLNKLFGFDDKQEILNVLNQLEKDISWAGIPQALLTIVDMVGDEITPEEVANLFTNIDEEEAIEEIEKMKQL